MEWDKGSNNVLKEERKQRRELMDGGMERWERGGTGEEVKGADERIRKSLWDRKRRSEKPEDQKNKKRTRGGRERVRE